jgi:hypothetical protein
MSMSEWILILVPVLMTFITAIGLIIIQRSINRNEKKREEREGCLIEYQIMLIEGNSTALTLGEATAKAVRDGHTNGDMTKALEEVRKFKERQSKYFNRQTVEHTVHI